MLLLFFVSLSQAAVYQVRPGSHRWTNPSSWEGNAVPPSSSNSTTIVVPRGSYMDASMLNSLSAGTIHITADPKAGTREASFFFPRLLVSTSVKAEAARLQFMGSAAVDGWSAVEDSVLNCQGVCTLIPLVPEQELLINSSYLIGGTQKQSVVKFSTVRFHAPEERRRRLELSGFLLPNLIMDTPVFTLGVTAIAGQIQFCPLRVLDCDAQFPPPGTTLENDGTLLLDTTNELIRVPIVNHQVMRLANGARVSSITVTSRGSLNLGCDFYAKEMMLFSGSKVARWLPNECQQQGTYLRITNLNGTGSVGDSFDRVLLENVRTRKGFTVSASVQASFNVSIDGNVNIMTPTVLFSGQLSGSLTMLEGETMILVCDEPSVSPNGTLSFAHASQKLIVPTAHDCWQNLPIILHKIHGKVQMQFSESVSENVTVMIVQSMENVIFSPPENNSVFREGDRIILGPLRTGVPTTVAPTLATVPTLVPAPTPSISPTLAPSTSPTKAPRAPFPWLKVGLSVGGGILMISILLTVLIVRCVRIRNRTYAPLAQTAPPGFED